MFEVSVGSDEMSRIDDIEAPSDSLVLRIIRERPWLLLVLSRVLDIGSGMFTATEVAESLGLNSYIVQRALWWLKKYGFVEEVPGSVPRKYKLKSVKDPRLSEIRQFRWVCGNTTVLMVSDIYVVMINRGDNIISRIIHRNIVDSVREALQKLNIERNIEELSRALGQPPQVIATVLRVLDTLFCRKR